MIVLMMMSAGDEVERAKQVSLKLQELKVEEAQLSDSSRVLVLPYPTIHYKVPERVRVTTASPIAERSFQFMGRERMTELLQVVDSLALLGKRIGDLRRNRPFQPSSVPQSHFSRLLIYGSPGWGKVTTYSHTITHTHTTH
jgi:hypothetical protein